MKPFRFSVPIFLLAGLAGAQTQSKSPDHPEHDQTLALEAMVVSAGPDAKSAFDLAQGTSVLVSDDLRRSVMATLGDTLAATPGVNATYYGPGASRPIIRGLGGDRVRMLDNGVGSLDASNVSPDHNVSVEPLLVDRIEVLRGPATLLYGSSAVGGVVNVIDNRIPAAAPERTLSGRTEVRYDSASRERTGVLATTVGSGPLAFQVNALRTETDDVRIPGYADPANPAHAGTLENSAIATHSVSAGGAWFSAGGNVGAAFSDYATLYGVPTGEPVKIDMHQRRADFRAEFTRDTGPFKSGRLRFGLADYRHAEIDADTGLPNTAFTNHAYEGRLELVQREAGDLTGTIGLQAAGSDFSAKGDEVVTPPSLTTSQALFALESYRLRPDLALQFGGRYEWQRIGLGEVAADLPVYPGYAATSGERRRDHGLSLAAGVVYNPGPDYSLGLSLAYTQRLPTAQELYSNGPHGGTGSYEIGSANLAQETSVGLDVTLRKRRGFVTGSVGAFVNRIQDFTFEQLDPTRYFDETAGVFRPTPMPTGAAGLPIYQYVGRDAFFAGGEAEVQLHLIDARERQLHLELSSDYVRARQTDDEEPLPRIPPLRVGATLRYATGPWNTGLTWRHAFAQDRTAPNETPTPGYTLVGADASYRVTAGPLEWEFFVRGSNLTDEDARVSTSFLKDIAPLPGRSATLGVRVAF
jgi:iron complex outermembrane receptor protein